MIYPVVDQSGSLLLAIRWVEGTLTGAFGTSIAILAIAAVGIMMLDGRLPFKRAASVILGCFILFAASAIANGLMMATSQPQVVQAAMLPPPKPLDAPPPMPAPAPYDPFAFASVPNAAASGQDIFHSHP